MIEKRAIPACVLPWSVNSAAVATGPPATGCILSPVTTAGRLLSVGITAAGRLLSAGSLCPIHSMAKGGQSAAGIMDMRSRSLTVHSWDPAHGSRARTRGRAAQPGPVNLKGT